jgi:nuclear protein localization family protein 4
VTLSRQTYRMTDHVEFATPALIEGLLSFWRQTGTQRFGYLLGTYQPYDKVPMGIKAVVEAIHEPPQEPHQDGISVGFPWEEQAKVEALAQACQSGGGGGGLQVVGIVYTDLTQDTSSEESKRSGKVVAKRHANSFFLSSLEVLFSAQLQRQYPTPSRFSINGQFSSRFVTCVVSGDIEGQISVEAYQVSDQAMAMVDADMVESSVDPGVVRVKEEGDERYIPDVFYRYKNKYGLEVKDNAKPCFPVEYLIVNVSR